MQLAHQYCLQDHGEIDQAHAKKRQKHSIAACTSIPALIDQELATAAVQYLVPEGTEGDPREAALEVLDQLVPLEVLASLDGRNARCAECDQSFMGRAFEVKALFGLLDRVYC